MHWMPKLYLLIYGLAILHKLLSNMTDLSRFMLCIRDFPHLFISANKFSPSWHNEVVVVNGFCAMLT